MKKIPLTLFVFLILFLTASFINAQTRGENFERKYGKPISKNKTTEEFYVRKDIILKVIYDDKNLPSEFLIFPTNNLNEIEGNLSDGIEKEVIPAEYRTGESNHLSFQSSCSGVGIETFRNVKISTYGSCNGVIKIEIKFGTFPNEKVKVIFEEEDL